MHPSAARSRTARCSGGSSRPTRRPVWRDIFDKMESGCEPYSRHGRRPGVSAAGGDRHDARRERARAREIPRRAMDAPAHRHAFNRLCRACASTAVGRRSTNALLAIPCDACNRARRCGCAAGSAIDCGSAVREHESQRGGRVFRRWSRRGAAERAGEDSRIAGGGTDVVLPVQGQE